MLPASRAASEWSPLHGHYHGCCAVRCDPRTASIRSTWDGRDPMRSTLGNDDPKQRRSSILTHQLTATEV